LVESESPVASVDRALRILKLIGEGGPGLTLDELAARLDIPKSSVHRILGALKYRRFAAQAEPSGPYFLGTEMLATAFRFYEAHDLRALVHPLLLTLREEFNETVHMAVLDGREIVYLDKVEASHSIRMTSVVGGRNPAHSTGVGKALLAWTYPTDAALRAWASQQGSLEERTRHTITSLDRLVEEMRRIRDRGYALDMEENEIGVRCVAVPVFLGRPAPVAALSVTAPKDRMPSSRLDERGVALRRKVAEEAGLGQS